MSSRSDYTENQHIHNLALLTAGVVAFVVVILVGDKLVHKAQILKECGAITLTCFGKLDGMER